MKKILLVAAVAGLSMVSCKKDYTCECTITTTVTGLPTTTQTTSGATGKMKKAEAEDKCNTGDSETTVPGSGTVKSACEIK